MTSTAWAITFDCTDAPALARFWIVALGYVEASPPEGWTTWEDWLVDLEVPEREWNDGASISDPSGVLPSIGFLKVPEGKTAKNRLHIDIKVSGGRHLDQDLRRERIETMVERLLQEGGSVVHYDEQSGVLDHVVMTDPEGNEFCVV